LLEVHGSIHHLQCLAPCCHEIWGNELVFEVDPATMRARRAAACPYCGGVARPNILMFGDCSWLSDRTSAQEDRFGRFLARLRGKKLVVIEMGAGNAVPTIRQMSESLGRQPGIEVIRINPREPQIETGHFSFKVGALEGLERLEESF
ncbi:MAG: NAD-dependent deacetylase, partial [Geopsychrobacter sp.]|nr:NAD-dependent deacetylase [Geopsychrobacter sp.]